MVAYSGTGLQDCSARPETVMGADTGVHGDYRLYRFMRPRWSVTTTLDPSQEHIFMPVVEMQHAIGDREIGSALASGLLQYMVEQRMTEHSTATPELLQEECRQLYREIRAKTTDWHDDPGVAMGGYIDTMPSSMLESFLLYYLQDLHEKRVVGQEIFGVRRGLRIVVADGGVRFASDDIETSGVVIPDDELVDFVAALARDGSRSPLKEVQSVVDALVKIS